MLRFVANTCQMVLASAIDIGRMMQWLKPGGPGESVQREKGRIQKTHHCPCPLNTNGPTFGAERQIEMQVRTLSPGFL